ncbi:MAG: hypothetical protein IIU50_05110, partial [Bacteroidaceae bacterium]|nr:hypothetical protein [Bacteroidaceae bacterium]
KRIVDALLEQTTYRKVSSTIDEFKETLSTSSDTNSVCMDYCSKITSIVSGNMNEDKLETISGGLDEVVEDMEKSKINPFIAILRSGSSDANQSKQDQYRFLHSLIF